MRYEVRMKYGDTLSVIEVNTKKEVYYYLKEFTGLRVSEIYCRNRFNTGRHIWREGRMDNHYWMVIDKDILWDNKNFEPLRKVTTHKFE